MAWAGERKASIQGVFHAVVVFAAATAPEASNTAFSVARRSDGSVMIPELQQLV